MPGLEADDLAAEGGTVDDLAVPVITVVALDPVGIDGYLLFRASGKKRAELLVCIGLLHIEPISAFNQKDVLPFIRKTAPQTMQRPKLEVCFPD